VTPHQREAEDPRRFGDPLKRDLLGFWKYRVGSFIIVEFQEDRVVVFVVRIGHRRNVYGGHLGTSEVVGRSVRTYN